MKFRRSQKLRIRASLDMTPMIDVILQLILFFMLSSTFVVQHSIPIEMPTAAGQGEMEEKDVSVTLAYGEGGPDGQGPIYVNDAPVTTMQDLSDQLSQIHQSKPDVLLLIRADANISTGRLVEVMGIANSVGIQHYGIAAQLPDNQP